MNEEDEQRFTKEIKDEWEKKLEELAEAGEGGNYGPARWHKVLLEVCMALAERIVIARLAKEAAGRQQAE